MSIIILLSFFAYILAIFVIAKIRGGHTNSNDTFYLAGRSTPWWIVAIGMIGDSISGVTFVSVPGMVGASSMSYIQLCIGFFLGYIAVAYILLPLYYRLQVVSIYEYLLQRFGRVSYKTGAVFFIFSKLFGAATKLYLISLILQTLAFESWGVPYPLTVIGLVAIIWLYTRRGGMGTIIWTDVLQTLCLVSTLALIIYEVSSQLGLNCEGIIKTVGSSPLHRFFFFDDWLSSQHFVKQVLSGAFIVIVMTGLDQNMMQKNLSCRTLQESQKNMLTYGFGFIPLNYLFLVLGILLLTYAQTKGISLPDRGDEILPFLASNYLGTGVVVLFTLGITTASFSNADSALTSLTTSTCVDLMDMREDNPRSERRREWVHLAVCLIFALMVLFIGGLQQSSVLNTIFVAVSYTYGPLLGLYAFGLMFKTEVQDRYTPYICIIAPLLSYAVSVGLGELGYKTGYELLLLNGLITMLGLWLIRKR